MSSDMAQYYHACGRINYELWQRHMALPAFSQSGELHVDTQQSVAEADAARERYGLDAVIMQVVSELGLSEIAGVPPIDLAFQLLSIIDPKISEGVSRTAQRLAGYFPISGKRFRSALLDAERELNQGRGLSGGNVYVLKFNLNGEPLIPEGNTPCSTGCGMEGYSIPLVGNGASSNAVELPLTCFVRRGSAYEQHESAIPALRIRNFADAVPYNFHTRFFS
ncbi:hypothetical protein HYV82_00440 [Candidatus Woesearchaeota archaeon]|nr:hypothetical protein [Candidatus Woesearchaeota archaeon]